MKNFVCFLLIYFSVLSLFAQHTNIEISSNNSPEEPSIAVNPNNTNELIAGSNIDNVYFSTDGGITWTENVLTSTFGVWGDPVIIFDVEGDAYFFHLANPQQGNWIDRIVCQKTTDGGLSWNNGSYAGLNGTKAQDKEWAIVDRSDNTIYMTWTEFDSYGSSSPSDFSNIMFSKSVDGGETWTDALKINEVSGDCIDDDNTVEGAVPALGINGEVYVAWAGPEGIVFDKSLDKGATWLDEDIFVTDFPNGWAFDIPGISRCNGLPITACDTSGLAYNGTIYINWSDQRNGALDTDVWLIKSTDGGETWGEPIRVNNDEAGKQQFFTWMAIDQMTGYLYFVFYDRRNHNDNKTDVYMAVSTDGGETFNNFKVSETPFLPNPNVFFGDYTNLTAHNNVVRPIWARLNNSQLSVLTAIIDVESVIVTNFQEIVQEDFLLENYPNPFSSETYYSFKLRRESEVNLYVSDVYGRTVCNLISSEILPTGKYVKSFNNERIKLPSGVYYFVLETAFKKEVRKFIIIE